MASASIGDPQSLNLFAYVTNNPVDFVDPNGLNASAGNNVCYMDGIMTDCSTVYDSLANGISELGRGYFGNLGFWIDYDVQTGNQFHSHTESRFILNQSIISIREQSKCRIDSNLFMAGDSGLIHPGLTKKSKSRASHQYGTQETIDAIREIGVFYNAIAQKLNADGIKLALVTRAGDLSKKNGAYTKEHKGHRTGGEFDIGLFRKDKANEGTTYKNERDYDRVSTTALIYILEKDPRVKLIRFNDPAIRSSKIVRDSKGRNTHDNHLHVEFYTGC